MKNYSDENFVEQLRAIKFPDYSNYTSVNKACWPIREKSNTKFWFDIDSLNAIGNHDKHYKKFKRSGKETD